MSQPLLKKGLHPAASDALREIHIEVSRIGQTIGSATASAGTHDADGAANGHPYSAATDFRIKDLTLLQIRQFLDKLGGVGFAAWYRPPNWDHIGGTSHVHGVYAGCPMKLSLRNQIHDYCHGKNGLQSHSLYLFHPPVQSSIDKVRELFLAHNPANG